jgi:hypothetical protein
MFVANQARARLRLAVNLDVGWTLRPIAPGRLAPGPRAHARSGQARGARARAHPQAQAARRLDALEQQEAGSRAEAAVHDRAAHLEEAQRAAASRRAAHDLQRPRFRDQGGRRDRPVPEPAAMPRPANAVAPNHQRSWIPWTMRLADKGDYSKASNCSSRRLNGNRRCELSLEPRLYCCRRQGARQDRARFPGQARRQGSSYREGERAPQDALADRRV